MIIFTVLGCILTVCVGLLLLHAMTLYIYVGTLYWYALYKTDCLHKKYKKKPFKCLGVLLFTKPLDIIDLLGCKTSNSLFILDCTNHVPKLTILKERVNANT